MAALFGLLLLLQVELGVSLPKPWDFYVAASLLAGAAAVFAIDQVRSYIRNLRAIGGEGDRAD